MRLATKLRKFLPRIIASKLEKTPTALAAEQARYFVVFSNSNEAPIEQITFTDNGTAEVADRIKNLLLEGGCGLYVQGEYFTQQKLDILNAMSKEHPLVIRVLKDGVCKVHSFDFIGFDSLNSIIRANLAFVRIKH